MTDPENKSSKPQGLSVAPSPFNAVKLELAVIIIVGLLLWIAVDSITNNHAAQIVILLIFGLLGAAWLIFRTHLLLRRLQKK
ncbi:hypothetical protein [Kaarinaea lacus]